MKHQKNSKKESGMKIQKGIESVKRNILAVVFMTFSVCMTQGQDPTAFTGDITLGIQTQVDAFNHSSISGNLSFSPTLGETITNINSLRTLTNVGGYVLISNVALLTSLSGLDNLTSIGGILAIYTNPSLTSLTGLENLSSIEGKLYIGVTTTGTNANNLKLVDYCAISGVVASDITESSDSTNEYFVANNAYNPTYAQIQSAVGCSSVIIIVLRKIYVYSASGSGSSGTALTLAELNSTGVTGIIAANLAAYNTAIAAKTDFADPATDSVDTLAELQTLITSVNSPVVGLSEYSSKSLVRLSPNPAIGFVRFFGLSSEEDYVIYNTLGVAVQSGIVFSEEKISIESLHAGLYFLKLGKLEVFKFLKE